MLRRPADIDPTTSALQHCVPVPNVADVEPLIAFCAAGKLYEVERWIAEERPIQCVPLTDRKMRRRETPLQTAVSRGFHSLAALLLANGYNPNGDCCECITPAIRSRDHDMVDLLLRFGANPSAVDFADVLETHDRRLMDRFIEAGVDPCGGNAVARALSCKGRPLLGFVRTYRERFPALQRQIDIALHGFVHRSDEKGVALMLWLGADPYAVTPESPYDSDEEFTSQGSAIRTALWREHAAICGRLFRKPVPSIRVADLFSAASYNCCPEVVKRLLAQGANPNAMEEGGSHILESFITTLASRFGSDVADRDRRGLESLELVLLAGGKWSPSDGELKSLRRSLLDGRAATVSKVVELLKRHQALSDSQLHELTRTPAMKRVLGGHTKYPRDYFSRCVAPQPVAPAIKTSRRGYWKRHWSQR